MATTQNEEISTININLREFVNTHKELGSGAEGKVFQYDEKTAVKIYDYSYVYVDKAVKTAKVRALSRINVESLTLPKGIVLDETCDSCGYYMDLIPKNPQYADFIALKRKIKSKKNIRLILRLIKLADDTIKRAHQNGIIVGDVRGNNFIIDPQDRVHLIDLDNCGYDEFPINLESWEMGILKRFYNEDYDGKDVDKFLSLLLLIDTLYPYLFIEKQDKEFFKRVVMSMNVSPQVKDGLMLIISSAHDKPYLSDVLSGVSDNQVLLKPSVYSKLSSESYRAHKRH